jgi:hypothetical protein
MPAITPTAKTIIPIIEPKIFQFVLPLDLLEDNPTTFISASFISLYCHKSTLEINTLSQLHLSHDKIQRILRKNANE